MAVHVSMIVFMYSQVARVARNERVKENFSRGDRILSILCVLVFVGEVEKGITHFNVCLECV